jgi:hypothetical protein
MNAFQVNDLQVTHRYSRTSMTLIPATKAQAAKGLPRNSANKKLYSVDDIPYNTKQTNRMPTALNWVVTVANMMDMMIDAITIPGISQRRCPNHSALGDAPLLKVSRVQEHHAPIMVGSDMRSTLQSGIYHCERWPHS